MLLFLLLLPLLASAALNSRQLGGAKRATVVKASPQYFKQANVQRTRVRIGPYPLKAAKAAGGSARSDSTLMGDTFFGAINNGFCNDNGPCSVLSSRLELEFENGKPATPATGIYMHHIITSNTQKRNTAFLSGCNRPATTGAARSAGTGFLGSSEDKRDAIYFFSNPNRTSLDSGYRLAKNDKFFSNVMVVNYNTAPKTIYVVYDTEWVPGDAIPDTKEILLSISSCGNRIALSKEGPTQSKSGKWTFLEDGKVTSARGHLHDGGTSVDVVVNNKVVCKSKAVYGGDASVTHSAISDMTPCYGPWPVKKGDTLAMYINYDLKQRPLRQTQGGHDTDVMGMLSVDFVASSQASSTQRGKQGLLAKKSNMIDVA